MHAGPAFLREAAWLSRERATAYCRLLLILSWLVAAGWIALSHGGLDPLGKPLGTDFVSFWTASELARQGRAVAVYSVAIHHAAEMALFGQAASDYTAFFYPPVFLLLCLPLAALPYLPSLAAWLGLTGFAFWRCLRSLLPQAWGALPILAYPAVLINMGHGQNGFLTAALFAGAMLAMPRRPVLAGLCFGCLVYKPHLGIMIPLALLAARRWTTFLAAAVTGLGLLLASAMVFGIETWRAFLATLPLARIALEQNMIGPEKMPSVFAAVRLLHGGIVPAYLLQMGVGVGVGVALVVALHRRPSPAGEGALIAAAALLGSPFLLDYDLTVLAVPLAWVLREALRGGFLPWEKVVLAGGFILPLIGRTMAGSLGVPLGPPVLLAVFVVVLRRVRIGCAAG